MRNKGWEGPMPVIAAVVVVAALSLLTVTVMSGFGPEDDDVALLDTEGYEPSTSTTSTTVRSTTTTTTTRPRRSTTTLALRPSTTEAPQVLGDVTVREPGTSPSSGGPAASPSPTTAAPSPGSAPAPAPTTAPPASTTAPPAPTTTTTTCWNSSDPACGPLSWRPDPGPYDVKAYAVRVPSSAYVGEAAVFAVNRVEPAGDDALDACTTWQVSDPGVVSTSSCEEVNRTCARYGPHAPPAASRDEVTHSRTITFETPGEHTVRVSGHTAARLADGCASPWLQSWSRTYTVIVRER